MTDNFKDYREALLNAVGQGDKTSATVEKLVQNGVENVFFVGCGGSLAVMYPAWYIMQELSDIPSFIFNAGEFNKLTHKKFGKNSLVITASYSGTTPETIEAVNIAKSKGAATIGFTGKMESPLSKAVDNVFVNNAKVGATDANLIMLYQIVFKLMKEMKDYDRYEDIAKCLNTLPDSLVGIKESAEEAAKKFAETYKNEKIFYTLGAGLGWGEAYAFAICILEEMQWLTAQPIHAGEYFHGPFEVVDENANLIILKGEDFSRPLIDRVIDFSKKYTDRLVIIDTKQYPLPGVSEAYRGYFTPFILSAVLDRFANCLADERNHPLSTRRYMGKVEY
ncbi:MAG: SIS domain-containing protein [Tepidanaerobacteraceae bacterium]|jgi:fructoselysine-6-P-deglycase FrlB-like protein|nr:SIS domain-containing protein [Tepidanaerobacteraceae bacterium]